MSNTYIHADKINLKKNLSVICCSIPETQKGYSSMLSFTVADINSTVAKLMALGAELDGPIRYEIHGKVYSKKCF